MRQIVSAITEELSRLSVDTTSSHYQHNQQVGDLQEKTTSKKRESISSLSHSPLIYHEATSKNEQDYEFYHTQDMTTRNDFVTNNSYPTTSRPYTITRFETTTSLMRVNTRAQNESREQLVRILGHLVRFSRGYIVYGNWMCERRKDETKYEYEFQRKFEQNELKECDKCDKSLLITSFRLYTAPILNIKQEPTIEILRNLEWDEYYRVFGLWKCQTCKKKWKSAYTWISLREFMFQRSARNLKDYYMQRCKKCNGDAKCSGEKRKDSDTSFLYDYQPLLLGE
ncbi:3464_t:CDS:10, partial [Acaulospora morrowiae]